MASSAPQVPKRMSRNKGQLYILLSDQIATRKEKTLLSISKPKSDDIVVLKGSLWKLVESDPDVSRNQRRLTLNSVDYESVILQTSSSEAEVLTQAEFDILIALSSMQERYKVYRDKLWMKEASEMDVGSIVHLLRFADLPDEVPGKIRYKGSLQTLKGTWFGVELSAEFQGKGTSDGSYMKQPYFSCALDTAVFVAINKLRISTRPQEFHEWNFIPTPEEHYENVTQPPLDVNERVVWVSDNGPEHGTVKWIGHLYDTRDGEWTVGVDFDNPVGTGTGKYKNKQLFRTKHNHASLIPILGLMKESEFGQPPPPPAPPDLPPADMSGIAIDRLPKAPPYTATAAPYSVPPPVMETNHHDLQRELAEKLNHHKMKLENSGRSGRASRRVDDEGDPFRTDEEMRSPSIEDLGSAEEKKRRLEENISMDEYHFASTNPEASAAVNQGTPTSGSSKPPPPSLPPRPAEEILAKKRALSIDSAPRPKPDAPPPPVPTSIAKGEAPPPPTLLLKHEAPPPPVSVKSEAPPRPMQTKPEAPPPPLGTKPEAPLPPMPVKAEAPLPPSSSVKYDAPLPPPPIDELDDANLSCKPEAPPPPPSDLSITDDAPPPPPPVVPQPLCEGEVMSDLTIGTLVEVCGVIQDVCPYGVIRWIGYLEDKSRPIAGVEMEEENDAWTDGTFSGVGLFVCPPHKALFVYLSKLRRDQRFSDDIIDDPVLSPQHQPVDFTLEDTPDISEMLILRSDFTPQNISDVCGLRRGIQGHNNSCYLDTILFSMFAFTSVFDHILYRPALGEDAAEDDKYTQVQTFLREGIVNPLRKNYFLRSEKVLKLREMLDSLYKIDGILGDEKDPEEFLTSLLGTVMCAEPLLKLSNGQECHSYQLFLDKVEGVVWPTTQYLLELSFMQANIKLAEVPQCLILHMPRIGNKYKMYNHIVPSMSVDITDILDYGARECGICGQLATYECKNCYSHFGKEIASISFCEKCSYNSHRHNKRAHHAPQPINVNDSYTSHYTPDQVIPREVLDLFAVVCIDTSHYVAYCKTSMHDDAPWVFFNSMADRVGGKNGFTVPEIRSHTDITDWITNLSAMDHSHTITDRELPEHIRRLVCDGYIFMYQSEMVSMYK